MRIERCMKKKVHVFVLIFVVIPMIGFAQKQAVEFIHIDIHPFVAYGRYSIIQLQNPELYDKLYASGDMFGGIQLRTETNINIHVLVGYESAHPSLVGAASSPDFFVKTKYAGVGVEYEYIAHKKQLWYLGFSSLLLYTHKHLHIEKSKTFSHSYNLTILGWRYSFAKRASLFFEAGAGESGFIRGGICL